MQPESMIMMLLPQAIRKIDEHLDAGAADAYREQPLAQDWARVAKVAEEAGEAVSELIQLTGQSPRKGTNLDARERLLAELADTALAAVLAIQHFTKDLSKTQAVLLACQRKALSRMERSQQVISEKGPYSYDYIAVTAGSAPVSEPPPLRAELLDEAKRLVCGERQDEYGPPRQSFARIAMTMTSLGFRAPDGGDVMPHDVALLMICVKLARLVQSPEKTDGWLDVAGYAALGAECAGD